MRKLVTLFAALCVLAPCTGYSNGLLTSDADLRNDLAWLSGSGAIQLDLSTWPLSQDAVKNALDHSHPQNQQQRQVIKRVQQRIARLKSDVVVKAHAFSARPSQPEPFSGALSAQNALSVSANQSGDWWDIHLQGNAENRQFIDDNSKYNVNGSYAAVKFANQWLAFGQLPQWWGPGNEGSLIRSDAARPVTGFLLQRAQQTAPETRWLQWIGPWQYQITAGQLAQYSAVPRTKLIGGRFAFQPSPALELGLSGIMQWGGEDRPSSLSDFAKAAIAEDYWGDNDPLGNHLAGFDFRYHLLEQFDIPVTVYGQMIGEHQSGVLPSDYMYLAGIEGHENYYDNIINWYVEYHNTKTNFHKRSESYTHNIYTDGYYQQGRPLGDAIGSDGQLVAIKTEFVTPENQRWSLRIYYAEVNPDSQQINKVFPQRDHLGGFELGWSGDIYRSVRLTTLAWYTESNDSDLGIGAGLEIPFNLN